MRIVRVERRVDVDVSVDVEVVEQIPVEWVSVRMFVEVRVQV